MKFATKELVENVVSEVANNSCFSVISKDRSFALTDDIIAQAMQPGDIVDRIEVFQIINSIFQDTPHGRLYCVLVEGRRYDAVPDKEGKIPQYFSKSTPVSSNKPKHAIVFNIDTGDAVAYFNDRPDSWIYDKEKETEQRHLDSIAKGIVGRALKEGSIKPNPDIAKLCKEKAVDVKYEKNDIPQEIASQVVASYILGYRNERIAYKEVKGVDNNIAHFFVTEKPKYYIGVTAQEDATPTKEDLQHALKYSDDKFEIFKRTYHKVDNLDGEPLYGEIYEGKTYNIVNGLIPMARLVPNKVEEFFFAYTKGGDFISSSFTTEQPISDKKELERLINNAMEYAKGQMGYGTKDPDVHVGELIQILPNLDSQRVEGCQWTEKFDNQYVQSK